MQSRTGLMGIAASTILFCALTLHAEEKKSEQIDLATAPEAVRVTINQEGGKDVSIKIKRKSEPGSHLYVVEYQKDGKEIELKIAEDGKLLAKEVEESDGDKDGDQEEKVSLDRLPATVKSSLLKEAAGATILEVEKEEKNGKTAYEAKIAKDGVKRKITISSDGNIIKEGKKAK